MTVTSPPGRQKDSVTMGSTTSTNDRRDCIRPTVASYSPHDVSASFEHQPCTVTRLQNIETPSTEFFRLWRIHMDSQLTPSIEFSADSVWEFVLADVRLQYVELLKLDGAVEVEFVTFDEQDTFIGAPLEAAAHETSWQVNSLGWVLIPASCDQNAHKIHLSNEWWIGLRNSFSHSVRSLMQYKLFLDRFLRLFIVPVRGEDFVRIIVTTHMPVVLETLADKSNHSLVGAKFLAQRLISKPAGEFPATVQDATDGTQEQPETEEYEFMSIVDLDIPSASAGTPTDPQARLPSSPKKKLVLGRSNSKELEANPTLLFKSSSKSGAQEDSEHTLAKPVKSKVPDCRANSIPSAPPLADVQQPPYASPLADTLPSAPPYAEIQPPISTPPLSADTVTSKALPHPSSPTVHSGGKLSLTLGAHAHEGYSTPPVCFVCLVCHQSPRFSSRI